MSDSHNSPSDISDHNSTIGLLHSSVHHTLERCDDAPQPKLMSLDMSLPASTVPQTTAGTNAASVPPRMTSTKRLLTGQVVHESTEQCEAMIRRV